MRRLPRLAAVLSASALAALAACDDALVTPERTGDGALAREVAAPFQTDSLAYTLRAGTVGYEARIHVTFTNPSQAPAYIVNCNGATGVSLEKLVDGRWQRVWSPAIPACLSAPIVVPAGGTWRTEIRVFGGYPGTNYHPQFAVTDVAGEYRAVWHDVLRSFQDRLPFGEPLPLEHRVSNRFVLAVQPR